MMIGRLRAAAARPSTLLRTSAQRTVPAIAQAIARPAASFIRHRSTAADNAVDAEAEWESAWMAATEHVYDSSRTFEESATGLRELVKTGLLTHTDLRDNPERFFKAHRLLARHAVKQGPGFWIRFTVHYNLCFGTVLAVGSPEQVASMRMRKLEGGEILVAG